ncbi:MAG: hypothetical protein GSR81_00395 [Desulfurococcales archaeon]|nr:hypothetical protein [Desulfurococcales archaeon]
MVRIIKLLPYIIALGIIIVYLPMITYAFYHQNYYSVNPGLSTAIEWYDLWPKDHGVEMTHSAATLAYLLYNPNKLDSYVAQPPVAAYVWKQGSSYQWYVRSSSVWCGDCGKNTIYIGFKWSHRNMQSSDISKFGTQGWYVDSSASGSPVDLSFGVNVGGQYVNVGVSVTLSDVSSASTSINKYISNGVLWLGKAEVNYQSTWGWELDNPWWCVASLQPTIYSNYLYNNRYYLPQYHIKITAQYYDPEGNIWYVTTPYILGDGTTGSGSGTWWNWEGYDTYIDIVSNQP